MRFDELQKNWEGFGDSNPLWAINTGQEDWVEEDFFKTGQADIDAIFSQVEELGIGLNRGRALDFGCGVGRLSLALAARFRVVEGVDISAPMIARAEQYRDHLLGDSGSEVSFRVNTALDLLAFEDESFDFVLSLVTLQHMKQEFSAGYIDEFCRLLTPGGVVVFQIPARRETLRLRLRGSVGRHFRKIQSYLGNTEPLMEMYGTSSSRVTELLEKNGVRLVAAIPDDRAETWESYTYFGIKD